MVCSMAATLNMTLERIAVVADDSPLIRDYVRAALGIGWCIYPVANGVEAVQYALAAHPQLIVLDVRMPRMNGIQACEQIRASPGCDAIPIVFLTAYDDEPLRQRAHRAGATMVIAKPFTIESLRAQINDVISRAPIGSMADQAIDRMDDANGGDRDILDVCRRADAAAEARSYASFADAMEAFHNEDRY